MKGGCHTYSYEPSTASGRSPILTQIQLGGGGTRSYQFGPAGHLESTALGSGITFFDTDAAGRLFNLERTLPPAGVAFRYDGRGYLTFADSARVLPFADGFESGTTCFWGATVGLMPPAPVCPPPKPTVHPTYSSEGLLHALTRNVAPQRSLVFHFAGRPVAQLDLTRSAESWKFLTTDHLGTPIVATNTSGSLLWQGGFEPFGADWSGAAGAGVFLRFPGQWEEAAWANAGVELYENVHRWYAAETGRYSQPDPLQLDGSDPNPYLYASARTLTLIDPLGLRVVPVQPPTPTAPPETLPPTVCPRPQAAPSPGVSSSPRTGAAVGAFFVGLFTARRLANQTLVEAFGSTNNPNKCRCTPDPDPPAKCDNLLAHDEGTCATWWLRRSTRGYRACLGAAMRRYQDCLRGVFPPRIPLSPSPFD